MKNSDYTDLLGKKGGLTAPDSYNTAWVARVPRADDATQPAWPQALVYLQEHQLADGGWGDPHVYYAHERTISTLAAMLALLEWGEPLQGKRIEQAVAALHRYGPDLAREPHEPIGFELLLPRLADEVERFNLQLPRQAWTRVEQIAAQKSALIGALRVEYDNPRTWWFNMEILPEDQLAAVGEQVLNEHGAIAISPSATAAYLRALRRNGQDSPRAAAFLDQVVSLSDGGAGVCYPIEGFEVMWTLDNYLRAGLSPEDPMLRPMLAWLRDYWNTSPSGMSHSRAFPVDDGDDTAVAFRVLRIAGLSISDRPLLRFWSENEGHYYTYPDERTPSVSAAVHGLSAFRQANWDAQHECIAAELTNWLREQMRTEGMLHDKWHVSPLYATSRVIEPLLGWDDQLARQCIDFILTHQRPDGGWGHTGTSTLEETALAVLGLVAARRNGRLADASPLRRAACYLAQHSLAQPVERLWIGKGLYRPVGVVNSLVHAARLALQIERIRAHPITDCTARQQASAIRWMS
ncbi:MAG TPA: prenyltransferase/squalene oxidase repeat-containing protein [Candidatus Sulfomarinibacteraceae bacterium]|nr:prenyltransferase/squalene oxidase repeat-containing protein [Candidatus Sulfomarinibacteraceae bacterium]